MSSPSPDSSYLSHVNGLRALAILGVLVYHLRASYCPAGYFGVDVFLVISGFLLFRSLLKPGAEETFHYGSYLLKKGWRILPSWFVLTVATCAVAFYLLPPERCFDIVKTARYSAFFQADHCIDKSGNYFNVYTQQNPLLHFWYLSITQQLYIIAPLLVIPLARHRSRRAAAILLACLGLISLIGYVFTTSSMVPITLRSGILGALGAFSTYYYLAPRFWEVVAGVGILLLPDFREKAALRAILGGLGLAGLLACFYLYKTGSPAIYLPVTCALLALRYADSGPAAWLLNSRPLQAIGTISFSLYLWHWPVMVFWKYCRLDAPTLWDEVGMIAVSLLLGALFWACIERRRFPSGAGRLRRNIACVGLILMPLSFIIAGTAYKKLTKTIGVNSTLHQIKDTPTENGVQVERMKPISESLRRGLEKLPEYGMILPPMHLGAAKDTPVFFLMGDSHAGHLNGALHAACVQENVGGIFLNNSTAPYWYRVHPQQKGDACVWNREIAECLLAYFKAHPEITHILLAQAWQRRMHNYEATDWRDGSVISVGEENLAATSFGLAEFCRRMRDIGKTVIIVQDTPEFKGVSPLDIWKRCLPDSTHLYPNCHVTAAEFAAMREVPDKIFRELEAAGLAVCLDPAPALMKDGVYPARLGGTFLYTDKDHLSDAGGRRVVNHLMPRLLELLGRKKP